MQSLMIMTPGPTSIHESVRMAGSKPMTNPDLDPSFYEDYGKICEDLKLLFNTDSNNKQDADALNDVIILGGEGILGLEASCASLIEKGDKVLCLGNGIFGHGFGEFAEMYGADVTYYTANGREAIDPTALHEFLKTSSDYKLATMVHCETPSGITNPVDQLCPLLKEYGILTVVDSVSALAGEPLKAGEWHMDIVIAGSQKCLSAPPGLTPMSISKDAWQMMSDRKTPIAGFYTNLTTYKDWQKNQWFPYTQPATLIAALGEAVTRATSDTALLVRHAKVADATRKSILASGLELFAQSGYSSTVTTVLMPDSINYSELFREMVDHHKIMIGGGLGDLQGKVFRIGHMGENCQIDKVFMTLKALDEIFRAHGIFNEKTPKLHLTFASVF